MLATYPKNQELPLKERKIHVSPQEFLERDQKERVFFNWAMLNINPYAIEFFEKVSEELNLLKS